VSAFAVLPRDRFKPVLHPSSEEGRALANFPMNRGFLEENSVTLNSDFAFNEIISQEALSLNDLL
jgi:hypothetical protein